MSLSGDSWVVALTAANATTGSIVQLFPTWAPTGVDPFSSHAAGSQIRRPVEGILENVQIQSDGTNGGVIEVEGNTIRILADEADAADEINETEVQKALERAKELRAQAKDQVSLHHAQQLMDRSAVRLKVAGLRRRSRR